MVVNVAANLAIEFKIPSLFVFLFEDSGLTQRIEPELATLIETYVKENVNNTSEMKRLLKNHVNHQIFKGKNLPEPSNKRFYPRAPAILQHMRRAKRKLCQSLIDQDYLQQKMKDWIVADPTAKMFFRPKG